MGISDRVLAVVLMVALLLALWAVSVVVWGAEAARFRLDSRSDLDGPGVSVLEDTATRTCYAVYELGGALVSLGPVECAAVAATRAVDTRKGIHRYTASQLPRP